MRKILNHAEFYEEGTVDDTPVLLMIPGVSCGGWFFQDALKYLLPDYKVLFFDNPGTQDKEMPMFLTIEDLVERVVKVLDEAGVQKCHVLGHSMGGFTAQELALRHPERVKDLVLVSTCYGGPFLQKESKRLSSVVMPRLKEFKLASKGESDADYRFIVSDKFASSQKYEEAYQFYMKHKPPQHVVARHFSCAARFSSYGRVHTLQNRVLVVHGDEDHLLDVEGGLLLARQMSNAWFWKVKECGHMPMVELDNFYPRVLDFLAGNDVGEKFPQDSPGSVSDNHYHTFNLFKNAFFSMLKGW